MTTALRIGAVTPLALRLGAAEALKAYLGPTLVWDKTTGSFGVPESLFDNTPPTYGAAGSYTVGNQFTVIAAGRITHIRYWHAAGCGGFNHALALWNGFTGVKLASTSDAAPDAFAGYREIALATPWLVVAGDLIHVSYLTGGGNFNYTDSTPPSFAPHLTMTTGAGYYAVGAVEAFPNNGAGGPHYHADVVYESQL
jgi:hypothetical protein